MRPIGSTGSNILRSIGFMVPTLRGSGECSSCDWQAGSDYVLVGARFDGHNRNGDLAWITQATITAAEPGWAFAFECTMYDVHYSTW